jgi:hypothetical protein
MSEDNCRWAVSLEGEAFDLEDARDLFAATAAIRVCTINVPVDRNPTVLLAEAFDHLDIPLKVTEASKPLVDLINGILFVREPSRKPLSTGAVHERQGDGTWHPGIIHGSETMEGRSRLKASGVVLSAPGGPPPPPPPPPPHTIWLKDALNDPVLSDVLTFLRRQPDWFDLYKAFEYMRDDINSRIGQHSQTQMGWPGKTDIDVFSASAQVHRHSPAKWGRYDLDTAMPLNEARNFVRSLTRTWLDWRCGTR